MLKRLVLLIAVAAFAGAPWVIHVHATRSRMNALPATTLWAWQRPEKLSFADPKKAAIGVLIGTLTLHSTPTFEPRRQPVFMAEGSKHVIVLRIEAPADANLSEAARRKAVDAIAVFAASPQTNAIQIDFDATASQRAFYRALLKDLRASLPKDMPLSMTALVSWCEGDDWIRDLPVDEAVPMYFRMGVDEQNIRRSHMDLKNLREPLCRTSVGVSLDEPWPRFGTGTRVYAFAPAAWTEADYTRTLEKLAR